MPPYFVDYVHYQVLCPVRHHSSRLLLRNEGHVMIRSFVSCCVLLAAATASFADDPAPIKLLISPARPPTPALKYQLLPDARINITGNAADVYNEVIEQLAKMPGGTSGFYELNELPLHELPKEQVRKALAAYDKVFELLDKAARCDHCDWGLRERLKKDGIATPLPEVQKMRECAVLISAKVRLEMAEGRFDKAANTLRTGVALARNVGESETLISFLVGVAIGAIMEGQIDQFISQPDAPNLYYALTDLPSPLISMRKSMQGERLWLSGTFPALGAAAADLDAGNLSEEDLKKTAKILKGLSDDRLGYAGRVYMAWNIMQKHELAKQALIDAGRPRDKVEAMPPLQVAFLHALLEYDAAMDELTVWQNQPYWEMMKSEKDVPRRYLKDRWKYYSSSAIPLTPLILPAIQKVTFARARIERKTALLRTLEAIRFYAADHDGTLPPTLGAIKEVPVPLDPVTGKAFEYELRGKVAKLRAPPPPDQTANAGTTVVYLLKIRQ
jgi:hypothetical protein